MAKKRKKRTTVASATEPLLRQISGYRKQVNYLRELTTYEEGRLSLVSGQIRELQGLLKKTQDDLAAVNQSRDRYYTQLIDLKSVLWDVIGADILNDEHKHLLRESGLLPLTKGVASK